MAGFDLVPVDGGSPMHLPEGETLLGRGPFLGVSDKRVSRHHGLLENLNGQLRIKPTHVNPCFCQSSLDDPPQPLDRNQWHKLGQGHIISLLPGKYIYKVVAVGGEDGTPRNSQALQDEDEAVIKSPPASPKPSDEPANHTRQGKGWTPRSHEQESRLGGSVDQKEPDEQLPNPPTSNQTEAGVAEAEKDKNEPKLEPKKRVLPAWMMVPIAAPKSPTTTKVLGAGNRGRGTATRTTSTNQGVAKRARDTAPLSGEEESEHSEAEPTPRKREKRKKSDEDEDEDEEEVQSKTAFKARQQVKPSKVEESEESDHFDVEEEDDGEAKRRRRRSFHSERQQHFYVQSGGQRVRGQGETASERSEGQQGASESGDVSGPAQSKARLRTTCPYGKDCYRKNPVHFQECSHPGDSDYEEDSAKDEEEEEEDADRPECPYGTDCYRKNPLHWKEYKHTKKTRAKKPVSYNNDDDDDDEFGDDDSFINDDSEDIGEDSDYEPPDSDDSGKEDLKRLKKEAKAFTKPK
ncbi:LOW QUALITY PROTEIN: aprataxin and PNK-like factor [Coregonus clupeaformis]|uniref:LOW QUALITY PROTEIN: aprataxin and PNK-like factor n=1 Tax=Coregonus clupeaformis TaxID=59861 RepID=UPI001E1C755C|nr:LOW QUALITY PROTEIN: aprataxin and PNK-like factor [Coregonus clupeaformis]